MTTTTHPHGVLKRAGSISAGPLRARKKFLRFFPDGFKDATYLAWERTYKWTAHEQWIAALDKPRFKSLLADSRYSEIAAQAVRIESRTNLLFSFEKMALRDAVKSSVGARLFATGLYDLLHGSGGAAALPQRFTRWVDAIAALPRRQTRVLTWPLVTVFGFLAQPEIHFFMKPLVTRRAAQIYGYELPYHSRPDWPMYASLLDFAHTVRNDLRDLHPRDMVDIQSFLWVQGSDEYE